MSEKVKAQLAAIKRALEIAADHLEQLEYLLDTQDQEEVKEIKPEFVEMP